ncbi:MAG TPA: AraC family transcriptional regulator [Polyangiaceae bacterium]|jgi:AraC-like DNA-binding protein|nr:AraC family transcriptional regulator [Polyangiaceae bacterium]
MLGALHVPVAPLSDFVANLWSLSDAPSHAKERIVPSGTLELVINLNEDEFRIHDRAGLARFQRFSGAIVSGAYDSYFVIDTAEHASVIGVHFKAGGALPVLGLPPGALAGRHVDLETLWGAEARNLREALCAASSSARRFPILEAALLARLREPRRRSAVDFALTALGKGTSVGDVVAELDLSHRRFIEIFTSEVGITPKSFGRIQRFQRAAELVRRDACADWSELAVQCGYFDQSHLIRDFVDFSGFSPTEFLHRSKARVKENHLPLGGAER